MAYRVAVVGATGNVGREMLNILSERRFPVSEVIPLASSRSVGVELSFGDRRVKVQNLENFDFSTVDFALMSAGSTVSREWGEKIGAQGCIAVDNSSYWRYHADVPLVVPEVNAHVLDAYMARNDRKNIIANPNCSTAQLVVALKPLHDAATIRRVVVATYQSVSGAGKEGQDELWAQTKGISSTTGRRRRSSRSRSPSTSSPISTSSWRTAPPRKSGRWWPRPRRSSTPRSSSPPPACACRLRRPFRGREPQFEKPITADEARDILREAPGVSVIDKREPGGYATPVECVGDYDTFVSRIREDVTVENGLSMWVVSDNLRKGAALNTVQILETLVERNLVERRAA